MSTSHQGARGTGYGDAAGRTKTSPWVMGLAVFAGALMITAGIFQVIAGIVALFQNEIYVVGQQYAVSFDVTTWGWIHLLVGVLVVAAGCGVITGQLWARVVGIGLAVLSMIANFAFLPYYPFWALAIIALNVFVIWALCSYDREAAGR
jgi:hypothetical protein